MFPTVNKSLIGQDQGDWNTGISCVFVFVFVFLCVFVFVVVIPGGLWIVCVISFQRIFGLIGWQWSCNDLLGCRGDLDF